MKPGYPFEDELVRKIHRKVGGPSKLSTYDDPARVREVVILALAEEQTSPSDARRVANGDLSAFERRVVRTVTNRGAAVRSRMRQRKELQRLREELRRKDRQLQDMQAALMSLTNANPVALAQISAQTRFPAQSGYLPQQFDHQMGVASGGNGGHIWGQSQMMNTQTTNAPPPSCTASSTGSLSTQATQGDADYVQLEASLDRDLFGNLIDQLISPLS